MTGTDDNEKISAEFRSRLTGADPKEQLGVVALLNVPVSGEKSADRIRERAERKARIEALKKASGPALEEIDATLERLGGKRLSREANALGCVSLTATVGAINALAHSGHIKAILEDQPISPLSGVPR